MTEQEQSPYMEFGRAEWAGLRANTPMTLSETDLAQLRDLNEAIALEEVVDIYLPLSRLLNLRVAATQHLFDTTSTFLGTLTPRVPFIVGIAGSVAVGKSTIARVLRELLARWPSHPRVELVTTDGFLYPNRVLDERGMMSRKGFPESYDVTRLLTMLADLKAGAPEVEVPLYSHVTYDVSDKTVIMSAPDIVIIEGINVLQVPPTRSSDDDRFVSDYFDFSIYIDGDEFDIKRWYTERTFALRDAARVDATSFFQFLVPFEDEQVHAFADMIWANVNGPNLRDNIAPTRSRADVIIEKGPDHSVSRVRLRK